MNKGLIRTTASLLFLLFIGGTILLPAFHRAHCADNHGSHEAAQCPICQLANTPVITTASRIAPIAESIIVGDVSLPQSFIASSPWRDPTQARAPPVA
ncbi:MAG: hypothetical protein KKG09_01935 [Verrucomicrobia bacterium]|nr:hypothetical protein [Verrucomicrobiota bacterium]MCG2678476.1 hypothetical protein [Kiritimatiellia bacterium]MBU4248079.1 hypothetical protein [Verrucomicrobiota bacterium]MBU4290235.1 hypothetical protein [Verrucomicrobiota bacterium]MBU4430208.1 hypothetical protein [Verrucomicrobiota bacterium]